MMLKSIKLKGFSIVACSNADYSSWCNGKAMAMNTTSGLMRGMSMPQRRLLSSIVYILVPLAAFVCSDSHLYDLWCIEALHLKRGVM